MKTFLLRVLVLSLAPLAHGADAVTERVFVRGTVVSYRETPWHATTTDMRSIRSLAYVITVKVTSPAGLSDPELRINSLKALSTDHILRKAGASVSFTVERKFIADLQAGRAWYLRESTPYLDHQVFEVREARKEPNKSPEPTP